VSGRTVGLCDPQRPGRSAPGAAVGPAAAHGARGPGGGCRPPGPPQRPARAGAVAAASCRPALGAARAGRTRRRWHQSCPSDVGAAAGRR